MLGHDECQALAVNASPVNEGEAGTRNMLAEPWCQALAARLRRHPGLAQLVPDDFVAVQCTYFEKSRDRNWLVSVHQDISIPVAQRVEHPGLGAWSAKEDGWYVQPGADLLARLLAVRLHIDACGAEDGPLRVMPGTHLQGLIKAETAAAMRQAASEVVCAAERGSALLMRPLLLHASSKASGHSRRRVLHFLYGPRTLPMGLRWQQAV